MDLGLGSPRKARCADMRGNKDEGDLLDLVAKLLSSAQSCSALASVTFETILVATASPVVTAAAEVKIGQASPSGLERDSQKHLDRSGAASQAAHSQESPARSSAP